MEYDWQALWDMAERRQGLGSWVQARYDGHCQGCGQYFEAGELIRYYEAEDGWLAECCGVEPPR